VVTKLCQSQQVVGAASPSGPATLRRVQSMTGPPNCNTNIIDRSQIRAKLDTLLASSLRGPRPNYPTCHPTAAAMMMAPSPAAMAATPQKEQIYVQVVALQQKTQQLQQNGDVRGNLTFADGKNFDGESSNDKQCAKGIHKKVYEGEYKSIEYPDGDEYYGLVNENGRKHGWGTLTYSRKCQHFLYFILFNLTAMKL